MGCKSDLVNCLSPGSSAGVEDRGLYCGDNIERKNTEWAKISLANFRLMFLKSFIGNEDKEFGDDTNIYGQYKY